MTFSRTLRRCAALAAAFGIALQALWPLLAQARPAQARISVPVCAVDGIPHSIELTLGKKQTEKCVEHCKLCVPGADRPLVASSSVSPLCRSLESKHEDVVEEVVLHLDSSVASLARPRAPPSSL